MTDPSEYLLHFEGGPVDPDYVISMAVPPTDVRWFVQYGEDSWWVYHGEPEQDVGVSITKYVKYKETLVDGEHHVYYSMETA